MDEIILRFPVMAEQIFEELDDQNLTKCRGISNTWYEATEKIQWKRKIQKLTGTKSIQFWDGLGYQQKENENHQMCGFHKKSFILNATLVSCPFPSSLLGGCNSKPTQK